MKTISHGEARLLVSKAWDHEIRTHEAEQLAHHLKHCPECAPYAREMYELLSGMDLSLGGSDAAATEQRDADVPGD